MAVSSSGGHYPCPSEADYGDPYQDSLPVAYNRNRPPQGPCFAYVHRGFCPKRPHCPWDHELAENYRQNGFPQSETPFKTQLSQINQFRESIHQTHQASSQSRHVPHQSHPVSPLPHQLCFNCHSPGPQGPVHHQCLPFGHQRAQRPPHTSQSSDRGSVYSQETSHRSHFQNHQPQNLQNLRDRDSANYQLYLQQQGSHYRAADRNYQSGSSQGSIGQSTFNSPRSHYAEAQNLRQGPVQQSSGFAGQQQLGGAPQQRYTNMRIQSGNGSFQGVPSGPRADRQNPKHSFSDRSSQQSLDDSRSPAYWPSSASLPPTNMSNSPKISHESHDLIDLSQDSEVTVSPSFRTVRNLLEEDIPEKGISLPTITAAIVPESRCILNNDLHELIEAFAETSASNGLSDIPVQQEIKRNVEEVNVTSSTLQSTQNAQGPIGASESRNVTSPIAQIEEIRLHGHKGDSVMASKVLSREKTSSATPLPKLESSTTESRVVTAKAESFVPSIGPEVVQALDILKRIAPHLRGTDIQHILNTLSASNDNFNSPVSPSAASTLEGLSDNRTSDTSNNSCQPEERPSQQVEERPSQQVEEAQSPPAVADSTSVSVSLIPSGSDPNSTITVPTASRLGPLEYERIPNPDDDSYPSSVFSSPSLSPRITTRLPETSVYCTDPLPFATELSFEEFKRKNICVSNVCFDRFYAADTSLTNGVNDFSPKSAENSTKSPAQNPPSLRVHNPRQEQSTTEEDSRGDSLLGPRPKPRWSHYSSSSRPPSPEPNSTSEEPQPLVRITRQHIFDIAYCWNCWSQKHKAIDCPDPQRSVNEREQLRVQKRIVSKSWARELESLGRQAVIIPIPGVSDEEAMKLQAAVPLRNPRKKFARHFSPAVSVYEENAGNQTDEQNWWNNTPPVPDISDAEIAVWANITVSSTAPQEGTYIEHPRSDTSVESAAETSISSESTEAHMDPDFDNSLFNFRINSESEDESTASLATSDRVCPQQATVEDCMGEDGVSSDSSGTSSGGIDIADDGDKVLDEKKSSSDETPKMRIREPRPEELQEPQVIFVGSESHTPSRRRQSNTISENCEQTYNASSSRRRYKHSRKYRSSVDAHISKLPTELLTQVIQYVGLQHLDDDPQNENTVHERAKAERTRALALKPLRFVNRKFYLIVQTIIYTRINVTAVQDLEKLARQLTLRERLANMVLDITVDINQARKNENWRDYGNARAIAKSREASQKMTIGQGYLMRDIVSIFENCRFLSRFAFHCTGAAQAFSRLDGQYPSIRKLSICDQLEVGKCGEMFWRNVQRCPNIEEISLLRPDENRDMDLRSIQLNPVGKGWAANIYQNLQYIKFTNAAEISDKVLLYILPNLPKLSRIFLYECKLVTSSGIARVVTEIRDRLTEFVYCDYVDCNGRTTHDEEKTKQSCHLCHALASCSNLRDLSLSAYRCCSDLFTMSNWPHLRNLKIDMMFYTGCNDEEDDSELREALVLACVGGRLPSLRKPNIIFQTNTPGLIYKRNRKFTQEELERASGFTH